MALDGNVILFGIQKKNQLNFKLKQNCCLGSSELGVGSNENLKLQSL